MAKQKKSSSKKGTKKTTKKKSSKKTAKKSSKKPRKKTTKKTSKKKSTKNSTTQTTLVEESENTEKQVINKEEEEKTVPEKEIKEVIEVSDARIDELERQKQQQMLEDQMPAKFWQKGAYTVLMDPTMVKSEELVKYDLSALLSEFTKEMLKEDIVDFRISGMAIYSAAKLHHKKIRDVIDEEEKVQLKELRERMKREIPKAMAQPLREPRKIATSEELFDAMRSAIIETMQKRELLRRRREKQIARREELKVIRSKGQLPKEILKHILGKNKTIEELLQEWFDKIKAKIKLNDKKFTTYDEMIEDVIEIEEKDAYGQKIKSIELFIALLFLSTNGKLNITQGEDFDDITIEIPRYIV
jgi:chromatin segregation and condensation protein Rec8/ScpA/Scc1 (kleisin family)